MREAFPSYWNQLVENMKDLLTALSAEQRRRHKETQGWEDGEWGHYCYWSRDL
jgi:hypothetical protein